MTRRRSKAKGGNPQSGTRTATLRVVQITPTTAEGVAGNFRLNLREGLFPGLGRELSTAQQWRVRRAQISFISSCSSQQAGTFAFVLAPPGQPTMGTRSAIVSSGGTVFPVTSAIRRSNTLGAQTDWVAANAAGATLHVEFSGVVGATIASPVVLGQLECVVTLEFRGSTV